MSGNKMGFGEKLKDIYYFGEEKWYNFWDKVDSHIPIYKVIDPIDGIVPSFALFLILIFILLLIFATTMFGALGPNSTPITVNVVDSSGNPIDGASVTISGINDTLTTNAFGLTKEINLNFGQYNITAKKDDKETKEVFFIDEQSETLQLTFATPRVEFSSKYLMFKTENGDLATGELRLTFACSSGIIQGVPAAQTIYGATANIAQPESCGTLTVSVASEKYNSDTFTLSGSSGNFVLVEKVAKTQVKAIVNLVYEGKNIADAVSVQAFSTGQSYMPIDTELAVNGQATFSLLEGDYTFKTAAEKGYKVASSSVTSLTKEGGQKTVTITLEKQYLGSVRAIIKEGSRVLSGVRVALLQENTQGSLQEIWAYDTNADGIAEFDVTQKGPFTIIATKDGYCDKSISAEIGDEVTLALKRFDGTCGHELKVKVVDSDGKKVQFAKVAIFSQTEDDLQKLSYVEKITDFNGEAKWNPVRKTADGEKYKVFAFKSAYSGWSEARELTTTTSADEFIVTLDIPMGVVRVIAKDMDGDPLQFSEVQLFDEYNAGAVSGKRMIEGVDGIIDFNLKADKMVYAVVKKEGYESFTTMPKQMVGNGTITFEAQLSRPPVEEIVVRPLGFYKNGQRAQKVEANQEYEAMFEITAPKNYRELGFFLRVGKDYTTKTEMDKIFIKSVYAGGNKSVLTGGTYNKPKGYTIDEKYLNLEENKWAQVVWREGGFVPGKIIVGVKVKVRTTAQQEERIDIGYRAWGLKDGDYERDPFDNELKTSENSSVKQALYALTKPDYITVGVETLCDTRDAEKSFCITSTYTDTEGFTHSFNDSFDALNNTPYNVSINVMNNSLIGFDNAKMMLDNTEENIVLNGYTIKTPRNETRQSAESTYKTDWIDISGFGKGLSVDLRDMNIVPQKTGSGSLLLRIREQNSLVFEKTFTVNISSDKKMNLTYMNDGEFKAEMPQVISGKFQVITIKAKNITSNLEIPDAIVKVFDRFGTKIYQTTTNALGVAPIEIPASFPGEKLTLKVEKPEFETFVKEFSVEENVVTVDPTELNFTVNPQTNKEDIESVKITNKTGLDLTIKEIKLTGKLKGVLSESKIESWFDQFIGTKILSQDYEEINFKVISSDYVPTATDLEGTFLITLSSEGKSWVQEIKSKIRVGLGKDVDNQSCLQITPTSWTAQTRGNMVELGVQLLNNCTVDKKPVQLKNLALSMTTTGTAAGDFTAIYKTAQVEISTAYSKVLKPTITPGEKIPLTLRFVPLAGSSGTATGSIIVEAQNNTDSAPQKITTEVKFNIDYENMQDCMSLGTGLISMDEGGEGSFAIINSCKFETQVQLDLGDMQAAVSEKDFTVKAGETKDVQIKAQEGQMVGAYNILVNARQPQTGRFELLDNVKVIINPVNSCFKLTRYEYDVYDSEFNNFDGIDRGYLTNSCVQKEVTAEVSGIIPFDNWQSVLTSALIGGIAGGAKGGKFAPDWLSNLWSGPENNSVKAGETEAAAKAKAAKQAELAAKRAEAAAKAEAAKIDAEIAETQRAIDNLEKDRSNLEKEIAAKPPATPEQQARLTALTSAKAGTQAKLDGLKSKANGQVEEVKNVPGQVTTALSGTNQRITTGMDDVQANANMGAGAKKGFLTRSKETILLSFSWMGRQLSSLGGETWSGLKKTGNEFKAITVDAWKNSANNLKKDPQTKKPEAKALKDYCDAKLKTKAVTPANIKSSDSPCPRGDSMSYYCEPAGDTDASCTIAAADPFAICAKGAEEKGWYFINVATEKVGCGSRVPLQLDNVPKGYLCCGEVEVDDEFEPDFSSTTLAVGAVNLAYKPVNDSSVSCYPAGEYTNKGEDASANEKNGTDEEDTTPTLSFIMTECTNAKEDDFYCQVETYEGESKYTYVKANGGSKCESSASEIIPEVFEMYGGKEIITGYCRYNPRDSLEAYRVHEIKDCGGTKIFALKTDKDLSINGYSTDQFYLAQVLLNYSANESGETDDIFDFTSSDSSNSNKGVNNNPSENKSATPVSTGGSTAVTTYEPSKNMTLTEIAQANGTTADAIGALPQNAWLTQARDEVIPAGTTVYIPSGNSTGQFLLATASTASTTLSNTNTTGTTSISDLMGSGLTNVITSAGVGMMGGSFLGGAFTSALISLLQAQDTKVDYKSTFYVPKVVITDFKLESENSIKVNTFDEDLVVYEYSSCTGSASTTSNSGTTTATSQASIDSSYAGTVLYDPQALNATTGLEEQIELEFTNTGGTENVNESKYQPFVGVLTVTGQETVYDEEYDYDDIKEAAEERGDDLTVDREGTFGTILNYIGGTGLIRETTAEMEADDLTVDEIKSYKKKFHLLFDSYEYVDCGPNTYPCTAKELSNCDVDGKNGYTGEEGLPKMKLAWNWGDVGINECDSDANPDSYNYCDTTQFSIMLLKRMMKMKEYFNSTSLTKCPSANDTLGTKTQDLATTDLDVAITSVEVKSTDSGATIKSIVQTNNNLEMSAKLNYVLKKNDGTEIAGACTEETKTFKSSVEFNCTLNKSVTGEGSFTLDVVMTPTLCSGCGNRVTGNDSIRTALVIGSTGASQCLAYKTSGDYFTKVLAANDELGTAEGDQILNYISFKANLVRDGFSSDFKNDFDEFLNRLANAPVDYIDGGFRELFLSDKFIVKWPEKPGAWTEGKYDATITVTFKNESWKWDNNNIESIVVNLAPQGPPEIPFAIYKVAFNGVVGLESDNGRQNYGAGYEQLTEDLFLVTNNNGTRVYARPNASNNAATVVRVATVEGVQAFNSLNTVPTRGNVLSIYGDDVVEFVLTPSVAVPLIMNITRNTSTDAYAFYSAEVDGQPQNTGGNFIVWNGIGQGCVDFEGRSMSSYSNEYDMLASNSLNGFTGYGLKAWSNVLRKGTISFYGTFYAPQNSSTIFKLIGATESASFESTMGNGTTISVNSSNATDTIATLSDVLDLVRQEKVCVVGGDYYWNNYGLRESLKGSIDAKESTCIPSKGN
jgi:LysM repeat protein